MSIISYFFGIICSLVMILNNKFDSALYHMLNHDFGYLEYSNVFLMAINQNTLLAFLKFA